MEIIHSNQAPEAIGPYSQAIRVGNVLYSSGQIAINPATGTVEATDIVGQSKQVMKNLEAVLKEAGATFANVVKTTCFLKDVAADFAAFNTVYAEAMCRCCRTAKGRSGRSRSHCCFIIFRRFS